MNLLKKSGISVKLLIEKFDKDGNLVETREI